MTEEPTLIEKLRQIEAHVPGGRTPPCLDRMDWSAVLAKIAGEAADAVEAAARVIVRAQWRPINTAPVEPAEKVPSYYQFRCLLQNARGEVGEGWGYYVKLGRATSHKTLRWANALGQCHPKYWMPLPAPLVLAGSSEDAGRKP